MSTRCLVRFPHLHSHFAALALAGGVLLAACEGNGTALSDGGVDQAAPRDLASAPADLGPPKVTLPAVCAPATVSAAMVFSSVFRSPCATSGCHGGPLLPSLGSATELPKMLGQASASDFPFIDPGLDIHRSYLLYKLTGEQRKVPHGGGDPMPPMGGLISDPSLCLVINWIKSGAK